MKDIRLTDNHDLAWQGGDFAVDECLAQSQTLLLMTNKGEWKQHPIMGVGVINYIETANDGRLQREIRSQFSIDGMKVNSVRLQGTQLDVDAVWK